MKRVDLNLGHLCNNNCRFCVSGENIRVGNEPLESLKRELLELSQKGATHLNFLGGEPTIRKDIFEIVSYAKKLGFRNIHIVSNGRMYSNKQFLKKLINAGVNRFTVSFHGHTPEIQNHLTRNPNSFEQTAQGIKNLVSLKKKFNLEFPIVTNTVINKINYRYLVEFTDFLIELGVDEIRLAFVRPMGNAYKYFNEIVPRYSDVIPFVHKAIDNCRDKSMLVKTEAIPYCLMQGHENNVGEIYDGPTEVKISIYSPSQDKKSRTTMADWKKKRIQDKRKGKGCKKCRYNNVCEGVWETYVKKRGFSEFKPINN